MTQITRRFFVNEIEVECSIGIYDHERAHKQRVIIDIEVVLDPMSEPTSDQILDGLDYDMIHDSVIELATARHYDLQETLARTIFDKMSAFYYVCTIEKERCFFNTHSLEPNPLSVRQKNSPLTLLPSAS